MPADDPVTSWASRPAGSFIEHCARWIWALRAQRRPTAGSAAWKGGDVSNQGGLKVGNDRSDVARVIAQVQMVST
jgi:hypothetical protein